jgi:dTDP-4-dehydrorhamnose 3,5-epimerase
VDETSFLIVGAYGQLGKALQAKYPKSAAVDRDQLDMTDWQAVSSFDWSKVKVILNAAAYTNVDGAEAEDGRAAAWQVNAVGVGHLVQIAAKRNLTLVHISTDYVFDGTKSPHTEDESVSPLSVYGASKAAGDILVGLSPNYYVLRASWLIGDGKNFVRTMLEVGKKDINPSVVSDQIGRPTFTSELVRVVDYLLSTKQPSGIYNTSNDGPVVSWADFTRQIFKTAGLSNTVTDVTTADYFKDKPPAAPRPAQSTLDLSKLQAAGFKSRNWQDDLADYINMESA